MTVQQLRDRLVQMDPAAEVVILATHPGDLRVARPMHVETGQIDDRGREGIYFDDVQGGTQQKRCVLIY